MITKFMKFNFLNLRKNIIFPFSKFNFSSITSPSSMDRFSHGFITYGGYCCDFRFMFDYMVQV